MVKRKGKATKSRTADPMTPPRSPDVEIQQPAHIPSDPPTVQVPVASSSESSLPPLPKERAKDQHPITSFFSKSPAPKAKGKQVLRAEAEEKTTEPAPPVAKWTKIPVRRSTRAAQLSQPSGQASSIQETPEPPRKEAEKSVPTPRKRKTAAVKLEVQGKEKRRPSLSREQPAPTPTKPSSTAAEHEESRPKIRRKQSARKSMIDDFDTTAFYPFLTSRAKASFEATIRHKQPIKERALDWEAAGDFIQDIITSLHWEQFCNKPDEGALMRRRMKKRKLLHILEERSHSLDTSHLPT